MTDMPLTAALAGAMFLLFLATRGSPRRRRWIYLSCYPLIGLALLAKGPAVTAVAMVGFLVYLAASCRLGSTLAEAHLLPGLVIVIAVAAPWYLYVAGRHPEFVGTFFLREHLGHLQGELARDEAWWGHLKNLVVGFYPWVAFLPGALAEAFKEKDRGHVLRFCAWWALTVVLIYSVAGSKLPHYLLPAFPPMALLVGAWLDAWLRRASLGRGGAAFGLSALAAGGALCVVGIVIALGCREWLQQKVAAQYGSWQVGTGPVVILAALALGSFGAAVAAAMGRRRALVPLLAGAMLFAAAAHTGWFKPHIAEIQAQPRKELAQLASAVLGETEPLGIFYAKRPATTFYARRPITDLGEDRPALLAAFLSSPSPATALTHVKCLEALPDMRGELHVWTRRGDYVLVSNHALERYFR
jgi:4-amino-4-deoxy-L-arabinose transferase-like glycosyltransferase